MNIPYFIEYARQKHEGQFRFDGKTPYFSHIEDVYNRVVAAGGDIFHQMVAIGHDLIEDTDVDGEMLESLGVPHDVVRAIEVLSKIEGQDYNEYLKAVKANPLARFVKINDMLSNLSDSPTKNQVKKYTKGLTFLIFD